MPPLLYLPLLALLGLGSAANNIQPKQYSLRLLIDTDKQEFSGDLVIDAKVAVAGALNFTLHNNGLNISTVSVVQQGGPNLFSSMSYNDDYQNTTISLSKGLSTGLSLKVSLTYQGAISTDQTGLFTFVDKGRRYYMTNFYPIYARKVFPCIDEPGAAANISVTIITTKDVGAPKASTSLLQTSDLPNGYKEYVLATTPAIAPYSLFFTLGDWNAASYILPSPNSILWLPPSLRSQTNVIDPNLIGALSNSNVSHFVSGLDHLNIFVAPTYKEETYSGLNTVVLRKDILINNLRETTTEMERDHLLKITYALWKLFFGTVLRPADWGDNWLTSSLPMYLAYKILDEPVFSSVYGTSNENLVPGLYERVFDTCSASESPVAYTAVAPSLAADILTFVESSGIEKGVYALKTVEPFFDSATLRSRLLAFLEERKNTAVDTPTFVNFIGQAADPKMGINITNVMLPMLSQTGYPLVAIKRDGGTLYTLKSNFIQVDSHPSKFAGQFTQLADVRSWLLPVTGTTYQNPDPRNASVFYFNTGTNILVIGYFPTDGWALLNLDGLGMMRTSYDFQSWSLFGSTAPSMFSPSTRAKLVADAFAAAESKVQSWMSTLKFLEALDSETHLAPWKTALAGFKRMWSWIYYTGSSGNLNSTGQINLVQPFKAYVRTRLTNIYQKLGPIGIDSDPQDPLRREIVTAMCEYGDPSCIRNLTAQYKALLDGGVDPSSDMLSVVVCNGLRDAKIEAWNSAFNKYIYSGSWFPQPLLNSHYSFLACPSSDGNQYSEAINSYLSAVLLQTGKKPFLQDQIIPAVTEILDKPQHVDQVLKFFVQNQPKFNFSTGLQAQMVVELGKRLTSPTQTAALSEFLRNHTVASDLSGAINAAIAAGNAKSQYILSVQSDVQAALNGETPTAPPTVSPPSTTTGTPGTSPETTTETPASSTKKPGAAAASAVSVVVILTTVAIALAAQ